MRPQSRRGHSCVRYDNFMIVYGGYRGRPLSDMWVLDTVSVRWSRFQTPTSAHGGKHPGQRTGHVSVIIGDKMWLFGGETENHKCVNDLWVFDLGLKKWEEIITAGSLPSPRYGHTAVAFGTSILLFGGADRSSECFHDLWCFDTTNYSWTRISTEPKPSPRHGHTMTTVSSSKILVFGGYGPGGRLNDIWQLDPFTLQWSPFEVVGEVPARRAYHSAVAMRFKLLVFGGQGAACMGDLWQFSPGSATWTKLNSSRSTDKVSIMENVVGPAGRYGHSGEVFGSDKMFIFGGVGDASVYRDDLWFLYVDLSLPEPLEMEMHGASAGLDISLPPIDSFSLPSSIPHLDDSSHTLATTATTTTTHNTSGHHDSVAVARRKRENNYDDDHQNATDSAEDFYASNGTTTNNNDNGGESFSNIEPATELDDGGESAAMADLQGMRDELAMQLDKVSTDSRRFLLDETRRTRALATHTRRHLWDAFTAGLDIVGLQPSADASDDDALTDGDVTRLLKEARILVDDDKELNENDVILTSYYAASFEKKLKRFDLRLREVERRVVEQEREIERQRAVTDSRTEEVVAYFEAKLEHEVKAAEARTLDALAEHRRLIDEAAARQNEQLMRELAELRSSVHHVVADNVKKEIEKEKEKEKLQQADDYAGKEEKREERVKRVEAEVVALAGELERMRARWDEAEAERDEEEEARLAEFEANLQRTMEGANALGSLMAEYFHQNDDNAGDQDSADTAADNAADANADSDCSGAQKVEDEEKGVLIETNAEVGEDEEGEEEEGNAEGEGEVTADAGDSVNVDEKEEDENEGDGDDGEGDNDGQIHDEGEQQDDDHSGEEESAAIEEEELDHTENRSL